MIQTQPDSPSIPASDQEAKQPKKQAKREAKLMLAMEQAQRDVEQAEKKVATARGKLEKRQTRVQELETQLSSLREVNHGASSEPGKEAASS